MEELRHSISKIENINIFKSLTNPDYNSCTIVFRDKENVPFLLYIEKMDSSLSINEESIEVNYMHIPLKKDFSFGCKIYPLNGTVLRIIDLSFKPTKEMTKEQIEEELGYKIKIV